MISLGFLQQKNGEKSAEILSLHHELWDSFSSIRSTI